MTLVMKKKVDIYLKHPERFQLDLLNQKSIWMDNVVRPLGTHYEASLKQVEAVKKVAEHRKKVQDARLAQIRARQEIVIGVLCFGLDIIGGAAMKGFNPLTKKFSSTKDFNHFLKSTGSFEEAFKKFNSQTSTLTDALVANLDDKLKTLGTPSGGKAMINAAESGIKKTHSVFASIKTQFPASLDMEWVGALQFQNKIETFYSSACRSINEVFVNLVRDADKSSVEVKKQVIELLVSIPYVMPPTLSLKNYGKSFADYFELTYWLQFVAATAKMNGSSGTIPNYHLAFTINDRILALTGHHFTNKGGKVNPSAPKRIEGGVLLARDTTTPAQYLWRGWSSAVQANYGKKMLAVGKNNVDKIFAALGTSSHNAYM